MPRGRPDPTAHAVHGGASWVAPVQPGSDRPNFDVVSYPSDTRPTLLVVVDCEEEFDWDHPVRGAAYTLESMSRLAPLQAVLEARDVRATYVVGYPIVDDVSAWKPLARLHADGRCQVGAHLHSWVTPPYPEHPSITHSFQGNLDASIEQAKMARLADRIESRFRMRPLVFKAGRFGFGQATAAALEALGFEIDVSFMPHWRYDEQGGPSFAFVPVDPFWLRPQGRLLEIPLTAGFTGLASGVGSWLYNQVDRPTLRFARLPGLLARSGLLNRVRLTPEGIPVSDAIRLTRSLFATGLRVFQVSFHSTSLVPGKNPYVESDRDLARLLDWIATYLDFFTGEFGGVAGHPEGVLQDARLRLKRAKPPFGAGPAQSVA